MSRYSKEHYEDVAKLLKKAPAATDMKAWFIQKFADLFAADNPAACDVCGQPNDEMLVGLHTFKGGFNREPFLAACGLEPESKGTHLPSDILGREY